MGGVGTGAREPGGAPDTLIPAPAVRAMFDAAAPRYDLLNRVLSLGIDRRWRRQAIGSLALEPGALLLDVCGGTGDLALAAVAQVPDVRVVNLDFSAPMLRLAAEKCAGSAVAQLRADARRLPLAAGVATGAVVGFGIRNVPDRRAALAELRRVLRPGGRLAILEFGLPRHAGWRTPYLLYLRRVLPRLADLVTGARGAYGYLAASILDFPDRPTFAALIAAAGFAGVRWRDLSGGIAVLYLARR